MEQASTSGTVDYTVTLPPVIVNTPTSDSSGVVAVNEDYIDFQSPDTDRFQSPYAKEFVELRSWCKLEETSFFNSLKARKIWKAEGGKSNASFVKTLDDRFILKEINEKEYRSFVDGMAEKYFDYLNQCLKSNHKTCLAKIFGVYVVKNALQQTQYMMVMENLMFGRDEIQVTYDLKGKLDRKLGPSTSVRVEEEFVNDVNEDSLYVSQTSKTTLLQALVRDTTFLQEVNVMDYSLLIGVDKTNHELICGIIDYLGPYNTLKKLESFAKSFVMGCTCSSQEPTVIRPSAYKRRFTTFMEKEFKCSLE